MKHIQQQRTHHAVDSGRYADAIDSYVFLYVTGRSWSSRVDPKSLFQHLSNNYRNKHVNKDRN